MVLLRSNSARLMIGIVTAMIVGILVTSSIRDVYAKHQRAEQIRLLRALLPAYQSRFRSATPQQVELAAVQEHAEGRGSGENKTFFFQERRVKGPFYCSAETVAIEVIVDQTRNRVRTVSLGGRFIDCL